MYLFAVSLSLSRADDAETIRIGWSGTYENYHGISPGLSVENAQRLEYEAYC